MIALAHSTHKIFQWITIDQFLIGNWFLFLNGIINDNMFCARYIIISCHLKPNLNYEAIEVKQYIFNNINVYSQGKQTVPPKNFLIIFSYFTLGLYTIFFFPHPSKKPLMIRFGGKNFYDFKKKKIPAAKITFPNVIDKLSITKRENSFECYCVLNIMSPVSQDMFIALYKRYIRYNNCHK